MRARFTEPTSDYWRAISHWRPFGSVRRLDHLGNPLVIKRLARRLAADCSAMQTSTELKGRMPSAEWSGIAAPMRPRCDPESGATATSQIFPSPILHSGHF